MRCALSTHCDMDRVVNPEAVTPAQRAALELCEVHSRDVAAAMERADRARTLAILMAPQPKPQVPVEQVVLRLCGRKKGATYEAIRTECGERPGREVSDVFQRLLDEKQIVPCGGRSRGSFKRAPAANLADASATSTGQAPEEIDHG